MTSIFLPPTSTRLVTICAHVDHGKTTLADNLIESNGIISERLAGTIRYLDSLEEEQRRGITIRTSAIGLKHQYINIKKQKNKQQSSIEQEDIIIHLLDSPGHSDFSTEVSSSLLCCDGCLLVVDAVEGICARTHQVIREAFVNQLFPILVINKIDRLCTNLCLSPTEAYIRIRTLIESINATCAAMIVSSKQLTTSTSSGSSSTDDTTTATSNNNNKSRGATTNDNKVQQQQQQDDDDDVVDEEEMRWTFEPYKGNVIFASALYGWGFTIPNLSKSLYRDKNNIINPNIKPIVLKQYLFGDYKYNHTTGKVLKWKIDSNSAHNEQPPMFAEFALQPIWNIYEGVAAAATSCGQTSQLFATTTSGISNFGGGGGSYGVGNTVDGSSSSSNNNQNNNKKTSSSSSKKEEKIKSTSPGMDQVLLAMQQGSTNTRDIQQQQQNQQFHHHLSLPTTSDMMQKILTQLGASTEDSVLRSLLRRYRPLSDTVLDSIYEQVPSPMDAAKTVRSHALTTFATTTTTTPDTTTPDTTTPEFDRIQQAVQTCQYTSDVPAVAQVCKFMAADRAHIRDSELDEILASSTKSGGGESTTSVIMGLARVLSGQLTTGHDYFVFGPKAPILNENDKTNGITLPPKRTIRLYLLMGSSFVKVDKVPAGHLCAIQNLEDLQLKTATLCDSPYGRPMVGLTDHRGVQVRPLVKVNVESVDAAETMVLERGLRKLSLADGAVEISSTSKGERILACLGELHLEQSILDLKNIYCERPIEFRISDPIVEFGETTDWFDSTTSETTDFRAFWNDCAKDGTPLRQATIPPYNEEEGLEHAHRGRVRAVLSGRVAAISLRVIPLSANVYSALRLGSVVEGSDEDLIQVAKALGIFKARTITDGGREDSASMCIEDAETLLNVLRESLCALDANGNNAIVESHSLNRGLTARGIISDKCEIYIPPARSEQESKQDEYDDNANMASDNHESQTGKDGYYSVREQIRQFGFGLSKSSNDGDGAVDNEAGTDLGHADAAALRIWKEALRGSVTAGFQHAMRAGPICEELVRGVMVVLEGVEIAVNCVDPSTNEYQCNKPLNGGMVVAALRSGIRCGLL